MVVSVWDNDVRFLEGALESVRGTATTAEVPIVVVDNASERPLPPLPGVSLLRSTERLSVGAARSLGVEKVQTRYVIVLDADDRILPGTIDFLVERMERDRRLAACVTSLLESDTGLRHRTPRRLVPQVARFPRLFALVNCVWSLYPTGGGTIMRTADVRAAGSYPDADWGDDWVIAVSIAFRGRIEIHRRFGLLYGTTPGSLWRTPKRVRELANSARMVRARLRADPAVPGWVGMALPVLALLQLATLYGLRPLYRAVRRARKFKAEHSGRI